MIISPVSRSFQKHHKLWKNMKNWEMSFISTKILWGTKEYTFSHGTEHTWSLRLQAVPQSDLKA
jgi:hypothetical protein